jgi:hypothetical protein
MKRMKKYKELLKHYVNLLKRINKNTINPGNKEEYDKAMREKELFEAEYSDLVMLSRRIK